MARVNKVNSYVVEGFSFNAWWTIAQCANPGDAHLVAKALSVHMSKTHRVMKNQGGAMHVLAEYAPSTEAA